MKPGMKTMRPSWTSIVRALLPPALAVCISLGLCAMKKAVVFFRMRSKKRVLAIKPRFCELISERYCTICWRAEDAPSSSA